MYRLTATFDKRRSRKLYILTYILSLFDLACTLYLTARFGNDIESNPFGKWLLSDKWATVIFKVVVVGALIFLLWRFRDYDIARWGMYIACGVYLLLALYHIILIGTIHTIIF